MRGCNIKLYWYILKEVIPQFFTTLTILSTILVVSQLVRLSRELLGFGLSLENILLPFLYIILPFMSFNIPIAFLGAIIISFGRFSSDGEYAAMLATGFPLKKSAVPVFIICTFLYVAAAACSVYGEPWGRKQLERFFYEKTQTEVDNLIKFRLQAGVFAEDFLRFVLYVEEISEDRSTFTNVMIAPGGSSDANWKIFAPKGTITGSVAEGKMSLNLKDGVLHSSSIESKEHSILKFDNMTLDILRLFREQILGGADAQYDYRSYSPNQLSDYVDKISKDPNVSREHYLKARFLWHYRFATPFVIFVFTCFGLVLGVTDPRSGKSRAYLGGVGGIIFGYVVVMTFKWFAEKGTIPAPIAAWLPIFLMTSFGFWLVYQKNRLPPSESPLDPTHIPLIVAMKKRWKLIRSRSIFNRS
ncbi:MAG: LptF/LptG family permease [Proteobacteria bacterium]|nr:LptF/LptG family permease [Pseudomonadota bacterium]